MSFKYVPLYCFGRGFKITNMMDNYSTPGPGAYDPDKNKIKNKSPVWRLKDKTQETEQHKKAKEINVYKNPAPCDYNTVGEYVNESKKPKAPGYSFGKANRDGKSKIKDKIKNKLDKKNKKNNNNNFGFHEEKMAKGDNAANIENNKENVNENENTHKKKKKELKVFKNVFDNDVEAGPGKYNLRTSLKVPTAKFGTAKKGLDYGNIVSPGPAAHNPLDKDIFGKNTLKYSISKGPRNIENRPFTPGPGKYETRKNIGDKDSKKYSFGHKPKLTYTKNNNPGPDKYDTRGIFGSEAKNILIKKPISKNENLNYNHPPQIRYDGFPAPNAYYPDYTILKKTYPKYKFGKAKKMYNYNNNYPSPDEYDIIGIENNNYKKPPSWIIGKSKRKPLSNIDKDIPGVGLYSLRNNRNQSAKYSFRPKYKIINDKTKIPGVGMYNVSKSSIVTFNKSPEWKFGKEIRAKSCSWRKNFPGPGQYCIPSSIG